MRAVVNTEYGGGGQCHHGEPDRLRVPRAVVRPALRRAPATEADDPRQRVRRCRRCRGRRPASCPHRPPSAISPASVERIADDPQGRVRRNGRCPGCPRRGTSGRRARSTRRAQGSRSPPGRDLRPRLEASRIWCRDLPRSTRASTTTTCRSTVHRVERSCTRIDPAPRRRRHELPRCRRRRCGNRESRPLGVDKAMRLSHQPGEPVEVPAVVRLVERSTTAAALVMRTSEAHVRVSRPDEHKAPGRSVAADDESGTSTW